LGGVGCGAVKGGCAACCAADAGCRLDVMCGRGRGERGRGGERVGVLEGLVEGWRIAEDVGRWYFGIRYDAAECANVVILLLQYSNATEKKQSTEIP
jgi:hypothetical protein